MKRKSYQPADLSGVAKLDVIDDVMLALRCGHLGMWFIYFILHCSRLSISNAWEKKRTPDRLYMYM